MLQLLHILISIKAAHSFECLKAPKGGEGVYPALDWSINRGAKILNSEPILKRLNQENDLECNIKCCRDYDPINYPCHLAVTDNGDSPLMSQCTHFSCINEDTGEFVCAFIDENEESERNFKYISWINPQTEILKQLITEDTEESPVRVAGLYNDNRSKAMTLGGQDTLDKSLNYNIQESNFRQPLPKQPLNNGPEISQSELNLAENVAKQTRKEDEKIEQKERTKIVTPLVLLLCLISAALIIILIQYMGLKKKIKYSSMKDNDYYSKLDPDDMAAEQEAQALINGAYDI